MPDPNYEMSGRDGQRPGMPGPVRLPTRLDSLYDEAMSRFDAFCFWYARPRRTVTGMRDIAQRLEAYGSPEALRIAEEVRQALAEAGA